MGLAKEFQSFKEATEDSTSASKVTLDRTARDLAAASKAKTELETTNAKLKEQLTVVTQEFSVYEDDSKRTIKQSSAALATSETALATSETALARANKSNNELESDNQQLQDQLMGLAKEFQSFKEATEDSTSASKVTLDRTARELAAVSKVKTELDTANAKLKQQLTTLTNEFNEYRDDAENTIKSSSADLSGREKTLAELQMLHKKDTVSIQALNKQVAEQTDSISALEAANALYREQLMALAQEFAAFKESSQSQGKKDTEEIAAV